MERHQSVCRLCLISVDPQEVRLLNTNQQLVKSIFNITAIEVASDSAINEYICNSCQMQLGQCVQFRTTCIDNDDIFRKMFFDTTTTKHSVEEEVLENTTEIEYLKVEPDDVLESIEQSAYVEPEPEPSHSDTDDNLEASKAENKTTKMRTARKKRSSKADASTPKVKKKYPQPSRKNATKVPCPECGAMIVHYNLKSHQEIHNPNRRKLTCPHCPKEFLCNKRRKIHVNAIHTQEIKYTCDQCGKVYLRPVSLKEHYIAAHSGEKRYECKECGERFTRATLRSHHQKRVHSTVRPYACEYCGKTFKMRSDFTVHVRIHTGEKPFKCDICGKSFNKSYNVVIHKKSHRNDKQMEVH